MNNHGSVNYSSGVLAKLRYIFQLATIVAREEGISRLSQFGDMLWLYRSRRLGPLLYYEQQLWKLPRAQQQRFFNEAQYRRKIQHLNPPMYQKLSQHKLVEKALFQSLGIPSADLIGYLHPCEGTDTRLNPLTNAVELASLLADLGSGQLCFKVSEGWGGNHFVAAALRMEAGEAQLRQLRGDAEWLPVAAFFERYLQAQVDQGLVIERYLKQHPVLAALNESSVNSLRIWVLQSEAQARVVGALLRIGRRGQVVDNASQGGILTKVDLITGRLAQAKSAAIFPQYFSSHPDSGAPIEGVELPHWDACLSLAAEALRVFPRARFCGLDMAITESGPVVIELNLEPDRISARNFGAPLEDLLTW